MSCFVSRMERKQQRRELKKATARQQEQYYGCSSCGNELFEADKKFESGTGFPSFWMHIENKVALKQLTTYGRQRTQLLCQQCGQHLGHLFPNKHTPTKVRYCINANSIVPGEEQE